MPCTPSLLIITRFIPSSVNLIRCGCRTRRCGNRLDLGGPASCGRCRCGAKVISTVVRVGVFSFSSGWRSSLKSRRLLGTAIHEPHSRKPGFGSSAEGKTAVIGLRLEIRTQVRGVLIAAAACTLGLGQTPLTIGLGDALARARQYSGQIQSANLAALQAKEDRVQARAAALPSLNAFNQYIYTEGDRTPSGVFVANDGVHVYNEQAVVHQELLSAVRRGEIRRAMAAEAVTRARLDVAVRGLSATVVQDYYAIVAAERKAKNSATSL